MRLAERISAATVSAGEIALFSLAQAGFCLKSPAGTTIWIDPYLTDCVERIAGFRRMIPTLVTPEEVRADLVLATHAHPDHLDVDALPAFARYPSARFVAAADCGAALGDCGIDASRITLLRAGDDVTMAGVEIHAVYADHGELAPEAIGLLVSVDGVRVYVAGDTALSPEAILATLPLPVDLMIAPINGAFGNLDGPQACELARRVAPRVLIGSHFWMFVEHGGDPAAFLAAAEESLPGVAALVMAPGEELWYARSQGITARRGFPAG